MIGIMILISIVVVIVIAHENRLRIKRRDILRKHNSSRITLPKGGA